MRSVYITGTDTGIGKTVVSTTLLHALRGHGLAAVGMKPVASGCTQTAQGWRNEDAEALWAVSYTHLDVYKRQLTTWPGARWWKTHCAISTWVARSLAKRKKHVSRKSRKPCLRCRRASRRTCWMPPMPMPVSYTHLDVYKRQAHAFEYDVAWTRRGIKLAPLTMPITGERTFAFPGLDRDAFKGLPGLLADTCLLYTSRCV